MCFTVTGCKKGEKASFAVTVIVVPCYLALSRCYGGRNYHLFSSTEKEPGPKSSVKPRKSAEERRGSGNSKSNPGESRPSKHTLYLTGASAESAVSRVKQQLLKLRAFT